MIDQAERVTPIHPEYVASVLDELADDDTAFTVDTGMCNVWAARYISPNGRRRVIGSFSHGSTANAPPLVIGAQFTDRKRQVVSMSGDGFPRTAPRTMTDPSALSIPPRVRPARLEDRAGRRRRPHAADGPLEPP